jgi:hypothetical protein
MGVVTSAEETNLVSIMKVKFSVIVVGERVGRGTMAFIAMTINRLRLFMGSVTFILVSSWKQNVTIVNNTTPSTFSLLFLGI